MRTFNSQYNLCLTTCFVFIYILVFTKAKLFKRCELGEILLANNFKHSEIGDWVCLAEKCSGLNSSFTNSPNTTTSTFYGILQFSNRWWCSDAIYPTTNECGVECDALLDEDLTDDLRCARMAQNGKPNFATWNQFEYCRGQNTSAYIDGCKFSYGNNNDTTSIQGGSGNEFESQSRNTATIIIGCSLAVIFILVVFVTYKVFLRCRIDKVHGSDCKPNLKTAELHSSESSTTNCTNTTNLAQEILKMSTIKALATALAEKGLYEYTKYEIEKGDLQIDKSIIYGKGHFGIVFGGVYKTEKVAVKTMQDDANSTSLIYELQVMASIGHHPYIVRFIGTFTDRLENDKLFLILEQCEFGCLQDYLRNNRKLCLNNPNTIENSYLQMNELVVDLDNDHLSLNDMILWSYQIADAMEYLTTKNIIHGDLATRNILLKQKSTIKLIDFGLSKKLHNYSIYKRTNAKEVPWRWLAPESLIDNSYSTKSDAWSYGVTLWEIFSLAQLPYSEYSCSDLVKKLKENYRLEKPDQTPDEIYDIMLSCWIYDSSHRPSFERIKQLYEELNANVELDVTFN